MEVSPSATINTSIAKPMESNGDSSATATNDPIPSVSVEGTKLALQAGKNLFETLDATPAAGASDGSPSDDAGTKHTTGQRQNDNSVEHGSADGRADGKGPRRGRAKSRTQSDDAEKPTAASRTQSVRRPRLFRVRRPRATTPITPGAVESGSASTSPQTTPEKIPPSDHKRRPTDKGNDAAAETTESQAEPEDGKGMEATAGENDKVTPQESAEPVESSEPAEGSQAEATTSAPAKEEISKPSSPAEFYEVKLDYPSFQTSGILEFEPDYIELSQSPPTQPVSTSQEPQSPPESTTTSESVAVEEKPDKDDGAAASPDTKPTRSREHRTIRTRKPTRRVLPELPPLPAAEEGSRPALAIFFETHGVQFLPNKRPYLQLTALAAAKREADPYFDVEILRQEFRAAFKSDMDIEWTNHEVLRSHIDSYFFRFDGQVFGEKTYVYNPMREAMSEFMRLSLEAEWIPELPSWDVEKWRQSLDAFEKIWSDKNAKLEHWRFKDASFYEFDDMLGHIFNDTIGKHMRAEDPEHQDSGHSTDSVQSDWTLQDYHAILDLGAPFDGEATKHPDTIHDTKLAIKELHLNLYDLLDWFRNPDNSHRPQRFDSVKALAQYSYSENKVFPRYEVAVSRVANPLLRPIGGLWRYDKLTRPKGGTRGPRPRGELGRTSAGTVVDDKPEDTSAAGESGQENGVRRRKWGRGRKRTTETSEAQPAAPVETTLPVAVEVTA